MCRLFGGNLEVTFVVSLDLTLFEDGVFGDRVARWTDVMKRRLGWCLRGLGNWRENTNWPKCAENGFWKLFRTIGQTVPVGIAVCTVIERAFLCVIKAEAEVVLTVITVVVMCAVGELRAHSFSKEAFYAKGIRWLLCKRTIVSMATQE